VAAFVRKTDSHRQTDRRKAEGYPETNEEIKQRQQRCWNHNTERLVRFMLQTTTYGSSLVPLQQQFYSDGTAKNTEEYNAK